MTGRIRCCKRDGVYTLNLMCPLCHAPTVTAHPARYSPEDRFGSYRRIGRDTCRKE